MWISEIRIYTYTHTCSSVCMCVYISVCMHACMYVRIYACITYVCMRVCKSEDTLLVLVIIHWAISPLWSKPSELTGNTPFHHPHPYLNSFMMFIVIWHDPVSLLQNIRISMAGTLRNFVTATVNHVPVSVEFGSRTHAHNTIFRSANSLIKHTTVFVFNLCVFMIQYTLNSLKITYSMCTTQCQMAYKWMLYYNTYGMTRKNLYKAIIGVIVLNGI